MMIMGRIMMIMMIMMIMGRIMMIMKYIMRRDEGDYEEE